MMGARTDVPLRDKIIVATAGPEPVFLEVNGEARDFSAAGSLLGFDATVTGVPGSTVPVPIRVRNPFNRPLAGTLTLTADGGWSVEASTLTFQVPAGAEREISATLRTPTAQTSAGNLKLTIKSQDLPVAITGQIRLATAVLVPRRAAAGVMGDFSKWGEPLVSLDRPNIVSLFEAAPLDNLLFRGPDDLRAKAYLARVPEGLSVAVRVQDDTFAQNEAAGDEWKGDSLQIGLATPDGGNYEWVAALTGTGPRITLSLAPPGTKTGPISIPLSIRREGTETLYEVLLPTELPGGKVLPDRFQFSFLVNDNDGGGRKGWIEWTPGIGQSKDPSRFRAIVVR
jgi:hypothetical protein